MNAATQLFNEALAQIGAKEDRNAIVSISGEADCISPRGPYITRLESARGNKMLFQQIGETGPLFTALINGEFAWGFNAESTEPQRLDPRTVAVVLGHDFLMLPLLLFARFPKPEFTGETTFADQPCMEVAINDYLGQPCQLYFATDSRRLVGISQANPMAPDEQIRVIFTSWHDVGKIRLPATVTIIDNSGEFRFTFRDVALNRLDEDTFTVPDSIRHRA